VSQSFDNGVVIIADDGSTDETVTVVNGYMKKDSRVKLLQLNHEGVCAARNAALKASVGKWVAFLDSDNTWTPSFLGVMVRAMTGEGIKAAYGSVEMIDGQGKKLYRTREI